MPCAGIGGTDWGPPNDVGTACVRMQGVRPRACASCAACVRLAVPARTRLAAAVSRGRNGDDGSAPRSIRERIPSIGHPPPPQGSARSHASIATRRRGRSNACTEMLVSPPPPTAPHAATLGNLLRLHLGTALGPAQLHTPSWAKAGLRIIVSAALTGPPHAPHTTLYCRLPPSSRERDQ